VTNLRTQTAKTGDVSSRWGGLFRTKSVEQSIRDTDEPDSKLRKDLTAWDLTIFGVAVVVGAGIFTLTARTAGEVAGPSVSLAFVFAAIACGLTALCYAEFASTVPVAGSAYTFSYATFGEIVAWIIGWDLILEYAVSNMAVSVGFAQHMVNMLDWFGWHPALRWISPAYLPAGLSGLQGEMLYAPGLHFGFNFPAFLVVMILTVVLVRGIRESAEANNTMVIIKIAAILAFIIAGAQYVHPGNWHPFAPNGWSGVLTGGSIIFFTYIGFDSVSTAAEEARNPRRDLPIGIIATLVVCTLLYIGVAVTLTGLVPWESVRDDAAPVVNSLKHLTEITGSAGLRWIRLGVLFGAMMGMISSLLVFQLGQARVWFSMSRDGLLPKLFCYVHPRFRTPSTATWIAGFVVGIPAGILDIGTLSDLSNIGTLFAFVLVSIGVIILRYREPNRHRGFRAPGGIAAPVLSVLFCGLLMGGLPILTWLRFFGWLLIGLGIYRFYSKKHSEFATN
jgi:APA family basic amino acid/polyamine antiporter